MYSKILILIIFTNLFVVNAYAQGDSVIKNKTSDQQNKVAKNDSIKKAKASKYSNIAKDSISKKTQNVVNIQPSKGQNSESNGWLDILKSLIPILTFFGGIGFQIWNTNRLEKKDLGKKKIYHQVAINSLIETIGRQIIKIPDFISQLESRKMGDYKFEYLIGLNKSNIEIISRLDAFKFLIKNSKKMTIENSNSFIELYTYIDLVNQIGIEIQEAISKFITNENKYHSLWNERVDKIRQFYDNVLSKEAKLELNLDEHPFLDKFCEICADWIDLNNHTDIYVIVDNLIKPTLDLCRMNIADSTELLSYSLSSLEAFENYQKNKDDCKILFESINQRLKDSYVKLKDNCLIQNNKG